MVTVDPQGDSLSENDSSDVPTHCVVRDVKEIPQIIIDVPVEDLDNGVTRFDHLVGLKYRGLTRETAKGIRPSGKGVMTLKGGSMFTGVWEGDLFDGYGTVTFPDDTVVYQGEWRSCILWGHGTMTDKGGCYTGEWVDGSADGQGIMEYSTGGVYSGGWKRHQRHGHGTMEYETGAVYTGYWENDQKQGSGTMTYTNGALCEGEWRDTECQGTLTTVEGGVSEGYLIKGVLKDGVVRPVNGPEYTVGKGLGASLPQPLQDETIESIVQQYCTLHFGDTLGDLRAEYGPATLAPLHTLVLYMPDTGSARLADLCESLRGLTLSVLNLSSAKSPSALKKTLASPLPQIVVCTHAVIDASPEAKLHKLHSCMWRELVKAGVTVRAYMCLDEDSIYEDEETARALYTRLAETVHSHNVLKLPKERQEALWERG
ncbi:hypothetical protein KIPB_008454 [Kipferlia bialata]|uniref:Uncharacterized protein n=1 Tax=Kipferlia bialata TaxID=797122 RepID=A0A391NNK0_9EUKA|nr:hypothetical protein KIPB_008454 [Kipferlia bialata]|eukprot:g8454.t1